MRARMKVQVRIDLYQEINSFEYCDSGSVISDCLRFVIINFNLIKLSNNFLIDAVMEIYIVFVISEYSYAAARKIMERPIRCFVERYFLFLIKLFDFNMIVL